MHLKSFTLPLFFTLFTFSAFAKDEVGLRTKILLSKADEAIARSDYKTAIEYYEKAQMASPSDLSIFTNLIQIYQQLNQYDKAVILFDKQIKNNKISEKEFAFNYANCLFYAGDFYKAKSVLDKYTLPNNVSINLKNNYNKLSKDLKFITSYKSKDSIIAPYNLGPNINSIYDEYFPSINAKSDELIITRKTNGVDEDFYISYKDSCGDWGVIEDMGSPPNSIKMEGAHMRSADGYYLFFQVCGNNSEDGQEMGGCDLYFSYTPDFKTWATPVPFGFTINTTSFEGMPCISPDNKTLYFVSDRPGGYGGKDIWYSNFDHGLWQVPINCGPNINTALDETAPFLSIDNKKLFFTSNGHPGFGGNDIFVSSRTSPLGNWSHPENLGWGINTQLEEVSPHINSDGDALYFSSNRPDAIGKMDIYTVELPLKFRPEPMSYLYGFVKDSLSTAKLRYAKLKFINANDLSTIAEIQSNRGDASYKIALPLGIPIVSQVYSGGYLERTDSMFFNVSNISNPDTMNYTLLPEYYTPPNEVVLEQSVNPKKLIINFNKNVYQLTKTDGINISDYITEVGIDFISKIEINGYTDNSGDYTINETIAMERARNVAKYIMNKFPNLGNENLIYQGWADANPIVTNDDEDNKKVNRRVEIILTLKD